MAETERLATEAKSDEIYRVAYDLYSQSPDWGTFYREVLGLNGLVRRRFPSPEALARFERTETYQQIHQLLRTLRERKPKVEQDGQEAEEAKKEEPTRVITVRLPRSLHESLRAEAHIHQTSMNKLCISKLLQLIDEELVPNESRRHE